MPEFVQLALPVPTDNLFTYSLPADFGQDHLVGCRALVPFGKRVLTGVIVNTQEADPGFDCRPITEILDNSPAFSRTMLNFTKWIADYYLSSWGEVLRAALPQGMSPQSLLNIHVLEYLGDEDIEAIDRRAPKRAALLKLLCERVGSVSVSFLERELKTDTVAVQLQALEQTGIIEIERVVEKETKPKFQLAVSINPELIDDNSKIKEALDILDKKAPKQSMLLSHIYLKQKSGEGPFLIADVLAETSAPHSSVKSLVEKGYLEISKIEINRGLLTDEEITLGKRDESLLELTGEQETALDLISDSIDKNSKRTFLLHGVTGSGKTLVYMHAIKKALTMGKSALVLVPEISLTPQLIDRFRRVFPEGIALMHSRMSIGERYDSWRMINTGEARIVLGARSALFAPLKNLGLIIVDEEHEFTYKQDSGGPKYHARDCAIVRGRMENALVVLGSATPSIESMFNANSGKYKLLQINTRADGAQMPRIKIFDTLESRKTGRMQGYFTDDLLDLTADRIQKNEGVIIFQNRRGFSSLLECPDCGHVPMCTNCSVSLTYHKQGGLLRCHYCGYTESVYKACHVCGHPELKELGSGTQRIEDELKELLLKRDVEAKIVRMDLDTTHRKGSHRKILQDFASGKTDILVGTQMVAKGLDFDRVTLVGVVNADLQLFLPDFRASERTFQLLTQVAGRAGRTREQPGEVIIQTNHPENPAVSYVNNGSYERFYSEEIISRKGALYPPFSRFVLIEFSGIDEAKTDLHSRQFSQYLPQKTSEIIRLGPIIPTIFRLRKKYRRVVILKNIKKADPSGAVLRKTLRYAYHEYRKKHSSSSVRISIDIDSFSGI